MRKTSAGRRVGFALAAAAVTIGCAVSVNAQVLDFASRGGFYSGSVQRATSTPLRYGRVVLPALPLRRLGDWSFFITAGPDSPLAGATWKALAWGCLNTIPSSACANSGNSTTPWFTSDLGFDPNAAGRSSLEVLGLTGQIDAVNWTPITRSSITIT